MGSIGALARCSAVVPFVLLIFASSCQPLAPPEKLVGRGVVQKVVTGDRRVVIAHEDIPGFMRAMTMSFEVRNPALLEHLAPGEQVRFTLEKTDQTLYLVAVEKDEGEGGPPAAQP
ncbi:MAG: copper-binding protein [Deltaproteobacteria bacterium]|nr:copper-binding protein [Deltaproteobacteria bacterium]